MSSRMIDFHQCQDQSALRKHFEEQRGASPWSNPYALRAYVYELEHALLKAQGAGDSADVAQVRDGVVAGRR